MDRIDDQSIITEIQSEYRKIEQKWLHLHYNTFIALVLVGSLIECILVIAFYVTGFIEISLSLYFTKYILAPVAANTVFLLVGIWAMHARCLKQHVKVYFVSLLFVCVCFIFFSVHCIFSSLYLIFTIPVLLTVVYSDYVLTTLTAAASITAKIVSELFVVWDPDKVNPLESSIGLTDFTISICILMVFYVSCLVVTRFERAKNSASLQKELERHQMQQKLLTDELTEIYNRTALRNALQHMEKDATSNTYAFVMIDFDNFKLLNDTQGHGKGDQYLREFGQILKKNCAEDSPFRFGGDEFCILFQNKTVEQVIAICKNIQSDLKQSSTTELGPLTISIGIARYTRPMTASQLLRNTDTALYRSKRMRDAICVYDD